MLFDPSHFVLQQLDYLQFIDLYHDRIRMFHVKDAEFHPSGRQGVYGGYQPWIERAGRFRSLGDGQVDFAGIFSKLTQYGFDRLGGDGMGMLYKEWRAGSGRGRAFHRPPYHSGGPSNRSTTSPVPALIGPRIAECWAWTKPASAEN